MLNEQHTCYYLTCMSIRGARVLPIFSLELARNYIQFFHARLATGIPAHVSHNKKLDQIMAKCDATHDMVSGFKDDMCTHIFQAVDEKVAGEGGVNHSTLQVSLEGLKNEILKWLESVSFNSRDRIGPTEDLPQVGGAVFAVASPHQFVYKGKFWCLPEAFQFPVGATRQSGWRMWLTGSSFMDPDGTKEWRLKSFCLSKGLTCILLL